MGYSGPERRAENQEVKHLTSILEAHIKEDNERFKELLNTTHGLDLKLSNLIVLNTETLKSQMNLMANNQIMVNKHNEFLFGNGNGEKGVSLRIDRLEGAEESRKWTFKLLWASIITLITKTFYDVLVKR